jgi:hypothetical protein
VVGDHPKATVLGLLKGPKLGETDLDGPASDAADVERE